ncbi:hypothetical protein [Lysinibacillus sp. 54212]|uniref:hypothetical protein n=1 Tax=Lysinibacillus sp. 54212 TaxID=3119829 RepID=UPI002FC9E76D
MAEKEMQATENGTGVDTNTGEIVEKKTNAVATQATGSSYITMILEETKRGFIEANAGMDLDFVRMGDWLTIDSKGNFVEKDDDTVKYGDSIDVVVGYGEQRYSLWGHEGSPEEGQLIVAEPKRDDALAALGEYLAQNPEAAERYSEEDVKLRYMAYVVPVATLTPDDFPKIYLMSFSQTDSFGWGRYAMNCFQGKYKNAGVPSRTAVNKVVTRLTTAERKQESRKWIGIDFTPVGLFDPKDFGINPEEQQ